MTCLFFCTLNIVQYNTNGICIAPIHDKSGSKVRSLCDIPLVIELREEIGFKSGFKLGSGC